MRLHTIGAMPKVAVACLASLLVSLLVPGCTWLRGRPAEVVALRLTDIGEEGDPARRASLRLAIEGLESDADGESARARGLYERALQVDPTNPYAYLALARHEAEGIDPGRALAPLAQARLRFQQEALDTKAVEVHLTGLEGAVWYATGRIDAGVQALEEARRTAPEAWADGRLEAHELR